MLDFLNIILPVFKYVNENFEDFDRFNKVRQQERRFVRHKDLIPYLEARDLEGYRKAVEDHLIAYVEYIKAANMPNPTK
jgi:GntR family transcriptional repressor for pyruvate dehydrogenase complex